MRTKYHTFEEFSELEHAPGNDGLSAHQLMVMYRDAIGRNAPIVLELGASQGASTTVFLEACHSNDGKLVSVDIEDCSDISDSPRWQFVQCNSADVKAIISAVPHLEKGIDILYVDSLHTREHVKAELVGWYPYLNKGAKIFFDDVDATPYKKGQRKDNYSFECRWSSIREYLEDFFYANSDELRLHVVLGSTGLGCLHKLSPLGSKPKEEVRLSERSSGILGAVRYQPSSLVPSRIRSAIKQFLPG